MKKIPLVAIVALLIPATTMARPSAYQRFTNPPTAAKRLSAAARKDGVTLFHPCAVVNPYLIRCGGSAPGGDRSGVTRHRVTFLWRKVNPYMLAWAAYQFGKWDYGTIDTKVAY